MHNKIHTLHQGHYCKQQWEFLNMQLGEYSLFHYHNTAQYLDTSAGWELWFPETNNWNNRGMRQENQINNYEDDLPNTNTTTTNKNNIFI